MVGFVKERAGEQILPGLLEPLSTDILSPDGYFTRACHWFSKLRNAEAAFILCVAPLSTHDLWIHDYQLGIRVFFKCDIDYRQAFRNANLGRR